MFRFSWGMKSLDLNRSERSSICFFEQMKKWFFFVRSWWWEWSSRWCSSERDDSHGEQNDDIQIIIVSIVDRMISSIWSFFIVKKMCEKWCYQRISFHHFERFSVICLSKFIFVTVRSPSSSLCRDLSWRFVSKGNGELIECIKTLRSSQRRSRDIRWSDSNFRSDMNLNISKCQRYQRISWLSQLDIIRSLFR